MQYGIVDLLTKSCLTKCRHFVSMNIMDKNIKTATKMKQLFIFIFYTLLPLTAGAYDAYIDGIYYNLNKTNKTASVTNSNYKYTGRIDIPENITYEKEKYNVTSIGYYAFTNCTDLTFVRIPNSVTSIESCAFENCTGLNSISIPSSVVSIAGHAFYNTGWYNSQKEGLIYLDKCLLGYKGKINEDITIDEGTRLLADGALGSCQDLFFITIPSSVIYIGSGAFSNCTSLVSINIPDGVTSIEGGTFSGCTGLITAIVGKGVTSIGAQAFKNCTGLTTINIPDGVSLIGDRAFYNCSSLSSITIPNNVTSIEEYTFWNCQNLASLSIGDGVTSIGNYSFSNCAKVSSLTIPNSVTAIGEGAFQCCYNLPSLNIPNSVTSIGEKAFEGCNNIESITIPEGLKIIKRGTFMHCSSLKSLTIPSTIQYIYGEAFAYCNNIKEVISLPEVPPFMYDDSFTNYDITLKVPEASRETYMSTSPWKNFKSIVIFNNDMPETKKCAVPTITYQNGQLSLNCDTEGVSFVTKITDNDIKTFYDANISLSVTYTITVYTQKTGYNDSDVATATLCWIDADPSTEGITDGIANVNAKAVLIQATGNTLSISGAQEGTPINIYDISGKSVGSATADTENTIILTSLKPGDIGLVKIGEKTIKIIM